MRAAHRLRVISLAARGHDWLDVAAATEHGIVVTHVMEKQGAEAVADMAWGFLLAVARQIPQHDRQVRAGDFHRGMGVSLWGKTLGIVGLGHIGRAVARRAAGFDMTLLATLRRPDRDFVERHQVEIVSLKALLDRSDFVSLHLPLDDSTRGVIGFSQLGQMKRSAFLVNTARRELVNENDLNRALVEHQLAGAGLDDPPSDSNHPLARRHNVVFTPHLGNRARGAVDAVFRGAVENAANVLAGRACQCIINPDVLGRRSHRAPDGKGGDHK